jgi:hypothetical protein
MSYEPTSLYSEIVQNLFMGGTADDDVIKEGLSKLSDLAKEIFPEYIDKLSLSQFT